MWGGGTGSPSVSGFFLLQPRLLKGLPGGPGALASLPLPRRLPLWISSGHSPTDLFMRPCVSLEGKERRGSLCRSSCLNLGGKGASARLPLTWEQGISQKSMDCTSASVSPQNVRHRVHSLQQIFRGALSHGPRETETLVFLFVPREFA